MLWRIRVQFAGVESQSSSEVSSDCGTEEDVEGRKI